MRHERAPMSRRVTMAAAGRYTPRGRPVEARPHDTPVCHVTRYQIRVREWSLGAERLSAFVANNHSRPPDTPLGVLATGVYSDPDGDSTRKRKRNTQGNSEQSG